MAQLDHTVGVEVTRIVARIQGANAEPARKLIPRKITVRRISAPSASDLDR